MNLTTCKHKANRIAQSIYNNMDLGCSFIVLKCDELEFVNKQFSIINFPLFVQGIINYPYTLYDIIFSIKHHGEHLAMLYEK